MNAPLRRGACPALDTPMPTGDGLLIRLSPVSGGFPPKQLIGLCESTARNGNGVVEVTARGNLQFRGFDPASARRFAEDIDALEIAVRTGVPVETSPLAGMDPSETADPARLAGRIRRAIADTGLESTLGPKVSVVVDGGGRISMEEIAADVRLTAERRDGRTVWRVVIGGDAEAPALGWYAEDEAVEVALRVLAEIGALGRYARARDLVSADRLKALRCFAPPSAEWGAKEHGPRTAENRDPVDSDNLSGWDFDTYLLKDGRGALPIALPFGHSNTQRLVELVQHAEAYGVADIRPAPRRRLLLICPSTDTIETLHEAAASLGFVTQSADPRSRISACAGAPACASARIAARDIAADVAKVLEDSSVAGLSIHISGCTKGCARQAAADITIVGGENGVGLVVHGTTKATPLAYRSADGLPGALRAVADLLSEESRPGHRPDARGKYPARQTGARRPDVQTATGQAAALRPANLARLVAAFEQG